MRIFILEIKRVLKTRSTWILLILALLLTFLLAWIPTTFFYSSYTDDSGNLVELTGLDSIAYEKELQSEAAGAVTPEKVREAVEIYQACLNHYGVEQSYDLPAGVYETEILPYVPVIHGVKTLFADPATGIEPTLMEIDPEKIDDYYQACEDQLAAQMVREQGNNLSARNTAMNMYADVEKPFEVYPGFNSNALDYQTMLAFLIVLFCAVIAAPIFSAEYQSGADDILRCTRRGKCYLAAVKILSALCISGIAYMICTVLYILISNTLFGWECTKTSIQMIYSILTLADMDLGQLQWFLAWTGLLCVLAVVSFTLFLSANFRSTVAALATALLFCLLPLIISVIMPESISNWLCSILPAGGVGLQTSILYAVQDFNFFNIGNMAVWTPYAAVIAYIIEIPLFAGLTVYSYVRHTVR